MIVWRIERLVNEHFEIVGFVRCDMYSRRHAEALAMSIVGIARLVAAYGISVTVLSWAHTHLGGDSLTSWTWRCHTW
jgi:hypothetical protein